MQTGYHRFCHVTNNQMSFFFFINYYFSRLWLFCIRLLANYNIRPACIIIKKKKTTVIYEYSISDVFFFF